jgi:hypothetical protein
MESEKLQQRRKVSIADLLTTAGQLQSLRRDDRAKYTGNFESLKPMTDLVADENN